ncbi:SAM-dependent methyltransferase [Amycolatopsis azurea]|uniref:SAM-dependent methyltransferase n=1 Tax=Amycolatopsis azurea TaxID=36819 RepID=UPI0037F4D9FD
MIPATPRWRDGEVPHWGEPCPRPVGCCKGLHTPVHRANNQTLWSSLPAPCGQRPHPARVDDALRGGTFASPRDRRLAAELLRISPAAAEAVKERDSFTARVVEDALAEGITQFLDLGCGFADGSATYRALAGTRATGSTPRLVLVDNDTEVHEHNHAWLDHSPGRDHLSAHAVRGNCFAVDTMLTDLSNADILDLDRPVCVLAVDLLHYLERGRTPQSIIHRLTTRLPAGSWIVITHLTNQPLLPALPSSARAALRDDTARWCRAYERCIPPHPRACSPATFTDWLTGLELHPPATITSQACWPGPDTTRHPCPPFTLAAVGRVPTTGPLSGTRHSAHASVRAPARDMLAGVLARSGETRESFADSIGYPSAQLNQVLNHRGRVTPELAHAVARRYDCDPLALLTLQDHAELAAATARRRQTAAAGSAPAANQSPLRVDVDESASAVEVLRAVHAATRLNLTTFAATLGYNRTTIAKTLSGHPAITAAVADSIAWHYGIDAADLLARQARSQLAALADRDRSTRGADTPPA